MKCIKCSKELPEGSVFCCFCGEKQKCQCNICGTELVAGALFCHKCGAKQGTKAPETTGVQETCVSLSAPEKHKDIHGFYNTSYLNFDVSRNLAVFSDGNGLFSATTDGKLYKRNDYPAVVATDGKNIYAVDDDYENNRLVLKTYSEKLSLISQKSLGVEGNLCRDGYQKIYTLTCDAYYQISLRVWGYNNPAEDIEILKSELDCPVPEKISVGSIAYGEYALCSVGNRLLVNDDILYFDASATNGEESIELVIAYDISEESYEIIWHGAGGGKPLFFDFEKEIMWTTAKKSEESNLPVNAVVSRKIAPFAPMLYSSEIWSLNESSLRYFDGKKAYEAPSYYQFYGADKNGRRSENWNPSTHGMADRAILWNENIIMNLEDFDIYSIYPAEFDCPSESRRRKLENVKVD